MSDEWEDFTSEVEKGSLKKGPDCTMGLYLQGLTKLARIQVEAALDRKELMTTSIARAMRSRGANISDFTVRRHRRGDCSCTKNGQ